MTPLVATWSLEPKFLILNFQSLSTERLFLYAEIPIIRWHFINRAGKRYFALVTFLRFSKVLFERIRCQILRWQPTRFLSWFGRR